MQADALLTTEHSTGASSTVLATDEDTKNACSDHGGNIPEDFAAAGQ